MFARYFVELRMSPPEVKDALIREPRAWLPGAADRAGNQANLLLADVGFGNRIHIGKTVEVELGSPVVAATTTILPLYWTALGAPGAFPTLDADLEIAPLSANRTQLSINARYVPPFGKLGRAVDRAVLSRVAEATIKDFLDNVAGALTKKRTDRIAGPDQRREASDPSPAKIRP